MTRDLSRPDLEAIARRIDRIQARMQKTSVDAVLALGKELSDARELFGERGDGFRQWAKERCGYCNATITNLLRVHECIGSVLKNSTNIDLSALYLITDGRCPDEVMADVIAKANAGERVRHRDVEAAIAEASPQPPEIADPDGAACDACSGGSLDQDDPLASEGPDAADTDAVEPLAAEDAAGMEEDGGQDAGKEAVSFGSEVWRLIFACWQRHPETSRLEAEAIIRGCAERLREDYQ